MPFREMPPLLRRLVTRSLCLNQADGSAEAHLRHIDQAWRTYPEYAATIAPVYARLLVSLGQDQSAALEMLATAVTLRPHADTHALLIETLYSYGQPQRAREQLKLALATHAVKLGGALDRAATALLDTDHRAWVGVTPEWTVVSRTLDAAPLLQLSIGGHAVERRRLTERRGTGGNLYQLRLNIEEYHKVITSLINGVEAMGSGLSVPEDFGLTTLTQLRSGHLGGSLRFGWAPELTKAIRVVDESGQETHRRLRWDPVTQSASYNWAAARKLLPGNRWEFSIKNPAGQWTPLPDSPFLWPKAARHRLPKLRARAPRVVPKKRPDITIIIPVYEGFEQTRACLRSVLKTASSTAHILVIDDASPDPQLVIYLDRLARSGRIELLRHLKNQGFVQAINTALEHCTGHDVVLLNSDTEVFGDWVQRLRVTAYSKPTVGTVTPWSNDGSIATYPGVAASAISSKEAATLDAQVRILHCKQSAVLPVGVGYCLYIRHDCLRITAPLDRLVFGKGYGEETDFCLRASQHGFTHRLAANVYVYHLGGLSFGARRDALLARARRLVNLRHPGYDAKIDAYLQRDPLKPLRQAIDQARLTAQQQPTVLLVSHAHGGGVEHFVEQRIAALRSGGMRTILLRPAKINEDEHVSLVTNELIAGDLQYTMPRDMNRLFTLLKKVRPVRVELHHFLNLSPRLIERLYKLDCPCDVQVHDYAWICPRITLIGQSGRYCGEPDVSVCTRCIKKLGSAFPKNLSTAQLRRRSERWLLNARHISVPTRDTALRLKRHFPTIKLTVQGHTATPPQPPISASRRTSRTRVAIIGALGEHKGYRILLACANDARRRKLPLEFVVIGYTQNDLKLTQTGRVFITGRYHPEEELSLLRREAPDLVFIPSLGPETWCYVLDSALSSGLPVGGFNLGAIRERLLTTITGFLLPLDITTQALNTAFLTRTAKSSIFGHGTLGLKA